MEILKQVEFLSLNMAAVVDQNLLAKKTVFTFLSAVTFCRLHCACTTVEPAAFDRVTSPIIN